MNRKFWLAYVIYVVLLIGIGALALKLCKPPEPQAIGSVVDKYEGEGKCFIEVQVEITPEEYIGYDIGDKYSQRDN